MKARVAAGADLLPRIAAKLSGLRLGLLTNPTGVDARFRTTLAACAEMPSVRLSALFACEHGLRGERQAGVRFEDEEHPELGIPVYSLYGTRKKPDAAMLEGVDAVLFDIQDIGVRFYTYLSTLVYMMAACAQTGRALYVLDRPHPLGALRAEGGLLQPGYESMVGAVAGTPYATGMTIGEYAGWVNDRLEQPCALTVVPMEGWKRGMRFDETGLPWIVPSPNVPTLDTVRVYAGTCLFEGTNVSEGRGTTRPFETVGAPWIDGERLAREFASFGLAGVHAHPLYFSPTFSKHQGELCGGVRLYVTEPDVFESVRAGLTLLRSMQKLYPETFRFLPPVREGGKAFIDLLTGDSLVAAELAEDGGLRRVLDRYEADIEGWKKERSGYLLYM
ncbi:MULTISPECIES: exo-beta-N-acetylmuramidase NamZ family protein [Paenibacillus]|uniref:exo-beta-N-acetylmuramidase NamZ family protein n=1 Tax=Paenibacillus TaxID=44249 RepID=UPI000FDC9736|nr:MULTISPECIES: DUF1343 domain-containing protein [Paenibacillus]